ncbi:MAG: response regulator [Planctomycetaceae bacterium]|nr:response regulator [Planctomycetaceae bacterium]
MVTNGGTMTAADWLEAVTLSKTFPMIIAMGSGLLLILAVLMYREFGKLAGPLEEKHRTYARDRRGTAQTLVQVVNGGGDSGTTVLTEPAMHTLPVSDPLRVLVVDDNAINLSVAQGLLRLEAIACHTATSGEEAMAMITDNDYALIFLDHVMPGWSGVETARRIRALPGDKGRTPIIALTANVGAEDRAHYFQAGMDDVMPKPIERDRLRGMLDKWLSRDTAESDGQAAELQ